MMKRIFSKRSGFTLVEIIVAFAIFAIMMSMIMQIMQLSINQRRANNEFAKDTATQREALIVNEKDTTFDAKTGDISLKFGKDTDASFALDVGMEYQIKNALETVENVGEGLNYFIADVNYDGEGMEVPPAEDDDTLTGAQMSRFDTRLTGIKKLDKININVTNRGLVDGKYRYVFTVSSDSDPMVYDDKMYSQFRMYFYDTTSYYSAIAKSEGDTVTSYKKCYVPVSVLEVGFGDGRSTTYDHYTDHYYVEKAGNATRALFYDDGTIARNDDGGIIYEQVQNAVRVSIYRNDGDKAKGFVKDRTVQFYVDFDRDPHLTANDFGKNASSGSYTKCPVYNEDGSESGEYHVNIYGCYPFETQDSAFGGSKWDEDKNPISVYRPGHPVYGYPVKDGLPGDDDSGDTPVTPPAGGDGGETPPAGGDGGDTPVEGGGE
ncbi:MAG: prepilin-type N-terminal cleavage/methylation domain-containing protein [Ruminococcus sp.]|nr:prepilin-type N-terminal cleavage/methylation domain-containing protein [Ruminococcus sp.]